MAHDAKMGCGIGGTFLLSSRYPVTLLPGPGLLRAHPSATSLLRPVLPPGREDALRPTWAPPELASSERHAPVLFRRR